MTEREQQIRARHAACPGPAERTDYCTGCYLLSVIDELRAAELREALRETLVLLLAKWRREWPDPTRGVISDAVNKCADELELVMTAHKKLTESVKEAP